jgi:rhodanese-related sulfurtransferase
MTVEELKERLDRGEKPLVLDVREPSELKVARYPFDVVEIPLGQLPRRFEELPEETEVICACRSGGRSAQAAQFLNRAGRRAVNLEGGILAWSRRIDPSVPQY